MANREGTPVWFELNSPDPEAAQDFYGAVAGWHFTVSPAPEHMGYRMGGPDPQEPVAGLMDATKVGGGHPGWLLYLASQDVDEDAKKVASLGGAVHAGPMDIPHVGRFAVVSDPQGVVFALMKGMSDADATAFRMAEPGSDASLGHGVWIELSTPDPDAAFAFYGALFGWTKGGAMPMGEMGEYAFIGQGGDDRPGAIMSSTLTGAPAQWNWYVHVPDIDAAIATATARGGAVLQGPDEIPGGSFSANLRDPQGYQVGLVGPRGGAAA